MGTSSQPKRKRATCGLGELVFIAVHHGSLRLKSKANKGSFFFAEFLVGLEPLSGSCPVGYSRIGKEGETEQEEGEEDELFICRDTASPYSVRSYTQISPELLGLTRSLLTVWT